MDKTPLRTIAEQSGTSTTALHRHKGHIPAAIARSAEARDEERATDLLRELRALRAKAVSILLKAEEQGQLRTALAGIREARACLEVLAELEGELHRNPQINILVAPEWITVRAVITEALQPFPTARVAVAQRLQELDGGLVGARA